MNTARGRILQYIADYRSKHSTECVAFEVLGRPQQVGSKVPYVPLNEKGQPYLTRHGRPVVNTTDSNKKAVPWMAAVRAAAAEVCRGPLLTGPLKLSALFYFSRPKSHFRTGRNADRLKASAPTFHAQSPDLAKLVRAIEDGMQGTVYRNDSQICVYGEIRREWTVEQERAEIWILGLEPEATGE